MKEFISACPRNCYSTCSFRVRVKNNVIHEILPLRDNLATPEGVCLKGLSYIERVRSKDRLLHPLWKNSNGEFEAVTWDFAIELIAKELKQTIRRHGPRALLFFAASGMSGLMNGMSTQFLKLLGGATITYGNLCWPAGLEATRLTLGENKHNAPWELKHAKLIIIWGKNPAETNAQEIIHIENAKENGATVVLIDPRRTETAEHAHALIQPKPGTDAVLALGLANYLIQQNKIDQSFIDTHVKGFQEFAQRCSEYTVSRVVETCEIGPSAFIYLAELIGSVKPATFIMGYGMQRFTNGGQTTRAILSLPIITGNIGLLGGGWQYANLQSSIFDDLKEPMSYFPENTPGSEFRKKVSMANPGPDILNLKKPGVDFLWVERANPLSQNPDINNTYKAFKDIRFKVVVEQFMTDTAQMADLILPAKSMFEQSDIIGSYWNPYIQYKPKVIDAPGEVKSELEIYHRIALAMGFKKGKINEYLVDYDDYSVMKYLKEIVDKKDGIEWDQIIKGPVLHESHESVAFHDKKFNTPSGKIELYSEQANELWSVDPLPNYCESSTEEKGEFQLLTPNAKDRIHSQFHFLELIKAVSEKPGILMNYQDADKHGLKNGEWITVFNERGEFSLPVKLNSYIKQGCLSVPNGWWIRNGGSVNKTSLGRLTDMGYGTAFHDNQVNIRKQTG
jgi:anaerobic selenocysteine-containing dehydrogenase